MSLLLCSFHHFVSKLGVSHVHLSETHSLLLSRKYSTYLPHHFPFGKTQSSSIPLWHFEQRVSLQWGKLASCKKKRKPQTLISENSMSRPFLQAHPSCLPSLNFTWN